MFILSYISSGLEFWSVNHTSMYENSKLKVFKNVALLCEISNNLQNDLIGRLYGRLLNHVVNHC